MRGGQAGKMAVRQGTHRPVRRSDTKRPRRTGGEGRGFGALAAFVGCGAAGARRLAGMTRSRRSLVLAAATMLLIPLWGISLLAKRIVAPGTAYVDLSYKQALALSTAYQGGIVAWVAFWVFYGHGFSSENLAAVGSFGLAYMSVILVEPLIDLGVLAGAKALEILVAGKAPGQLPVESLKRFSLLVNMQLAPSLRLYPPLDILNYAEVIAIGPAQGQPS